MQGYRVRCSQVGCVVLSDASPERGSSSHLYDIMMKDSKSIVFSRYFNPVCRDFINMVQSIFGLLSSSEIKLIMVISANESDSEIAV